MTEWTPLNDEENAFAVKAFNAAVPGVFGVAEAIDEMLRALHRKGVICRTLNSQYAQEVKL